MTIHLRLDETGPGHKMFSVLINGVNAGRLTLPHNDAIQFLSMFDLLTSTQHHKLILTGDWNEQ